MVHLANQMEDEEGDQSWNLAKIKKEIRETVVLMLRPEYLSSHPGIAWSVYIGVLTWNALLENLRHMTSLREFKANIIFMLQNVY